MGCAIGRVENREEEGSARKCRFPKHNLGFILQFLETNCATLGQQIASIHELPRRYIFS
jgi:hypothetical protein